MRQPPVFMISFDRLFHMKQLVLNIFVFFLLKETSVLVYNIGYERIVEERVGKWLKLLRS